ncbi:MAG: dTDP-4-dehydrorhamnose 3,5-epimerase family protein [Candidatus Doudnabacteria bacterium]|nr:dTDP-4-dehydrorhamnose 3,5-epimerase family protein [Candidatus Doudnabacteria bacterium]
MANLPTTEITAHTTDIPGLLVFSVSLMGDERGWLQEKFQKQKLVAASLPENFSPVQHSLSYNQKVGVTRGLHAEPWRKYVGVITGKVFGAYVDLREGPAFGKTAFVTIDQTTTVFIPKGVANSFQSIEPETYYSYLVDDYWSQERMPEYKFVNLEDPTLAIPWPVQLSEAIISDRDRNHPLLSSITPFTNV